MNPETFRPRPEEEPKHADIPPEVLQKLAALELGLSADASMEEIRRAISKQKPFGTTEDKK